MYLGVGGGAGRGHKLVTGLKDNRPAIMQALEYVARPAGFEPTTPWFVARYSIQLSYGREARHYISRCRAESRLRACGTKETRSRRCSRASRISSGANGAKARTSPSSMQALAPKSAPRSSS